MYFWNERKGETIVVEDACTKVYSTVGGERTVLMRPILITFEPFGKGRERKVGAGIPFRDSLAQSHLETGAVAEKIKMLGLGFWDDNGNDVTQDEIESFLSTHARRDREFIKVDEKGIWIPREDMTSIGTLWCAICEQTLLSEQALLSHRISPPHIKREHELQKREEMDKTNEAPPPRAKTKKAVEATA